MKNELLNKFDNLYSTSKEFCGSELEGNSIVAFVKKMNLEILTMFPDTFDGKPVKIAFDSYRKARSWQYITDFYRQPPDELVAEKEEAFVNKSYPIYDQQYLSSKLEEIYSGLECEEELVELFYEVHDGDDCITDLKNTYPYEYNLMYKIYQIYEFDGMIDEVTKYE